MMRRDLEDNEHIEFLFGGKGDRPIPLTPGARPSMTPSTTATVPN